MTKMYVHKYLWREDLFQSASQTGHCCETSHCSGQSPKDWTSTSKSPTYFHLSLLKVTAISATFISLISHSNSRKIISDSSKIENCTNYTSCPQKSKPKVFFAITLTTVHKFPSNLAGSCCSSN